MKTRSQTLDLLLKLFLEHNALYFLSPSVTCDWLQTLSSVEILSVHAGQWAFYLQGGHLSALVPSQPLRIHSIRSPSAAHRALEVWEMDWDESSYQGLRCCLWLLAVNLERWLIKGVKLFISRQWESWARGHPKVLITFTLSIIRAGNAPRQQGKDFCLINTWWFLAHYIHRIDSQGFQSPKSIIMWELV